MMFNPPLPRTLHVATLTAALVGAAVTFAPPTVQAQMQTLPELPVPSPVARVEQRVGLTDFAVAWSSPGAKGRKVWGGIVPFDTLWRTGANAATTLTASREFRFGGVAVPAGTYAVYSIPGKSEWSVILNTNAKTSGTRGYDEANNVAVVKVKPKSAPARERMTFLFAETTDDTTRLDLEWGALRVSVPIAVETTKHAMESIEQVLPEAWRPHFSSARWLLDSGGDLDLALGYADQSIAIKETWWNHWVRARILAGQDRKADAVAAAAKVEALGKGDPIFEGFFRADFEKTVAGWKK